VPKAYAAFFRNVNLGRPGSPSRAQLESAFLKAGATAVANVRTNGTVAFDAPDRAAARRVLERASAELGAVCGLAEPACVRSLVALKALPWAAVYADVDPGSVFEFTVSFSCSDDAPELELPLSSARGDAVVLWAGAGDVLSITRKVMAGPGSPNALLERTKRTPYTSRTLGTIQHVLAKHG
jgi:uncharacterized protein (DUF1697 family)